MQNSGPEGLLGRDVTPGADDAHAVQSLNLKDAVAISWKYPSGRVTGRSCHKGHLMSATNQICRQLGDQNGRADAFWSVALRDKENVHPFAPPEFAELSS
jgi:hypothetical protein